MNIWEVVAVVLIAALIPCLGICVFTAAADALAAFEVASTVLVCALIALSEGFHRQPFVDLAVVLAVVSIVGSLAFARMMEGEL